MELRVLFFTICCSVVCATIYVLERLRNGGRRVPLTPRYPNGVEQFRNSIAEFPEDCGSMKISSKQCHLLRFKCLRLVHPPPPDSILKKSFCVIRRALELMEDCCSENWILKAVEFGDYQPHFLEILLDLHRLLLLIRFGGESLGVMAAFDSSVETEIENLDKLRDDDMKELRNKLKSDYPDHSLKDQLEANPSSKQFKEAPVDIGRHVTEFDILSTCIHKGGSDGIFVFQVTEYNKELVIKARLNKPGAEEQEDIQLQNEAFFMKLCRHPYAVALLGSWYARKRKPDCSRIPLLLMEFMERDLDSKIKIKGNKSWRWWPWGSTGGLPTLDAINHVLPVAKVMKYLHGKGVVHLDLKPKNILCTRVPGTQDLPEDVSVKLADFGMAQMTADGVKGRVGTIGYMDPDIYKNRCVDLYKADVFSFGMVFGEVLTGLSPLKALGPKNFYGKLQALGLKIFYGKLYTLAAKDFYEILQEGKQVPLPKETPNFVKSIVESCWKLNPDERPSFDEICCELQKAEIQLLEGSA